MELLEGIRSRRSVRRFTGAKVSDKVVREIIRAGTWAPSGLNNQPWRFVIVRDPAVRRQLADLTRYGRILREAPVLIAVFVDRNAMYHPTKDHQAMGACLQNMLLAAHGLGLGAVWLGEILKNAAAVEKTLDVPPECNLMAVVATGHPGAVPSAPARKELSEVVVKEL